MKSQSSVLVIDDEQIICDSCKRILTNEGYKVETCTNPIEGFKNAINNNYDVILLDIIMGELNGLQLLDKLRIKKPDQPVIIVTGYPTTKSKEKSNSFGVLNYILKPFTPNEILSPVKNILEKINFSEENKPLKEEKLKKLFEWESIENNYWFHNSAWLQKGQKGHVRVGGQLQGYLNKYVKSISTPNVNDYIYRGLPIAEITLSNDAKYTIPSIVTGKIVELNTSLISDPSLFENNKNNDNWIARIIPENLKDDLSKAEKRKLLFFSKDIEKQNHYLKLITKLGYEINAAESIEHILDTIKKEGSSIVLLDAESLSDSGPKYVSTINKKFPDVRTIVFDKSGSKFETLYRQKKIFYYEVQPVSQIELISILNNAFFYLKDEQINESKQSTTLPTTIYKMQITNRHSQNVTLFIYDNICQRNKGIGLMLNNNLLKKSYPVEICLTEKNPTINDPDRKQMFLNEKEKSDKIILFYKENMNRISGTIVKYHEKYSNINGDDNSLIRITVQPPNKDNDCNDFNKDTEIALAKLIENEMISK